VSWTFHNRFVRSDHQQGLLFTIFVMSKIQQFVSKNLANFVKFTLLSTFSHNFPNFLFQKNHSSSAYQNLRKLFFSHLRSQIGNNNNFIRNVSDSLCTECNNKSDQRRMSVFISQQILTKWLHKYKNENFPLSLSDLTYLLSPRD